MEKKTSIDEIRKYCKDKGFIFPSSEIYNGFSGFFDYGPVGCLLQNKLKNLYRQFFVREGENIFEIDGSIITHPKVWEASGHTQNFSDLVLTTKKSRTKLRADHFIEDKLDISCDGIKADEINEIIKKNNLTYKNDNGEVEEFEEVQDFNLMFNTKVGAKEDTSNISYLRPETCQTIFTNFKNVVETNRAKIPFGICQVGKAFRNEISPRDFIFRCREFSQIEMEYFFLDDIKIDEKVLDYEIDLLDSQTQEKEKKDMRKVKLKDLNILNVHRFWIYNFMTFLTERVGIKKENLRIREHLKKELSHYSSATFDIDFKFPFGFKELVGIANREDYDLSQHKKFSGEKLEVFDNKKNESFTPKVIEPSIGLERLFFAVIQNFYEDGVLKLNTNLSPFTISIFPIQKNEEIIKFSKNLKKDLSKHFDIFYDENSDMRKRYKRSDEIGTKYSIVVDFESLENDMITLRDRDSRKSERVKTNEILNFIK